MADESDHGLESHVVEHALWQEEAHAGGGTGSVQADSAEQPVCATMLKRIAHCADGHRTGKKLRIRMDATPPYTAHEVIHDGVEVPKPRAGEKIVGPFLTCEDDDVMPKRRKVARVVVHYDDGTSTEVGHADALFWSMSALEKFCFPWYAAQYGPKAALRMWSDYANNKDMIVLCHDPRCEPCDVPAGGIQNVEAMLMARRVP